MLIFKLNINIETVLHYTYLYQVIIAELNERLFHHSLTKLQIINYNSKCNKITFILSVFRLLALLCYL